MPKYALSSFGRTYVADEEFDNLPLIRHIFAIVTGIIGIAAFIRFIFILKSVKHSNLKFSNLGKSTAGWVIIFYTISHFIHSIHFVDNIIRPVDYFEPKWLYQKYLISEMEITFFANFPITFSGLYFMEQLIRGINSEKHNEVAEACRKMTWYILGSLLTVGHYRTEPPWMYEAFVNFTIAGEGIGTIILAVLLYQLNKESKLKSRIRRAKMSDLDLDLDAEHSVGLLETGKPEVGRKGTGNVRARTPVK